MSDHAIPHFKNDKGLPAIAVHAKEFMCVGASPPFDHPHIFIDMGGDDEALCPYCSTLFRYDASLSEICAPAECLFDAAHAA